MEGKPVQMFKVKKITQTEREFRRFRLVVDESLYDSLLKQVKTSFAIADGVKLFYFDEENDRISVESAIELDAALASSPRVLVLGIEVVKNAPQAPEQQTGRGSHPREEPSLRLWKKVREEHQAKNQERQIQREKPAQEESKKEEKATKEEESKKDEKVTKEEESKKEEKKIQSEKKTVRFRETAQSSLDGSTCATTPKEDESEKPAQEEEESKKEEKATKKEKKCWWKGEEWRETRREVLDCMARDCERNLQSVTEKLDTHPDDQKLKLEKMVCEAKKDFLAEWIGSLSEKDDRISKERCCKFWHGLVVVSLKAHREFQAENGGGDERVAKKVKELEVQKACLELAMALF